MKFDFEKEDFINSLQEMVQDYGRMILADGKKCYSLWLDYAPQLTEEGELLKDFLELGLGKQVVELKGYSATERETWCMTAVNTMVKNGSSQKDAECLVEAVLDVLGWGATAGSVVTMKAQEEECRKESLSKLAVTTEKVPKEAPNPNVKMHQEQYTNSNSTLKAVTDGNNTVMNGGQPQKTSYTINDYIGEHTNAFMLLIMLGARVCLGIQCRVSCLCGDDALIYGIIFGIFALVIGYTRPWIMVICWFYCAVVSEDPSIGTGTSQGEWWGGAVTFLSVALVYRFILGRRYKSYMQKGKKQ